MANDVLSIEERNLTAATYATYQARISQMLGGLPPASTLYVDLSAVAFVSDEVAYYAIALPICGLRGGLLGSRHLVVFNPLDGVLDTLIRQADELDVPLMVLDPNGVLQVRGRALTPSLRRALHEVFRRPNGITVALLSKEVKSSAQQASDLLKRLAHWGLVSRTGVASGTRGRPTSKFFGFWPPEAVERLGVPRISLEIATYDSDPRPRVVLGPEVAGLRLAR